MVVCAPPVFRDVHHLSTFTVICGRWSGHPRGGKTAVLAGWEAGCMPMGEPLVRELVSPVKWWGSVLRTQKIVGEEGWRTA